ncbi:methyltransferase domain-containing protein [Arenibacterium sp. CAU 1754]
MTMTPALFDRSALLRNRARMRDDTLFLHRTALDEVQDRLSMVNRTFKSVGIVTPCPGIWKQAFPDATCVSDDDTLDLRPGTYDLVIHAMCLHWANDPIGQIIQCRRALVADGLFLGVQLGGATLRELRAALSEAESRVTGGLSPRVSPMAEIRDLGSVLQRSGLTLPVADAVELTVEYRDLTHLMRDLRHMGEANAMTGRLRHPTRQDVFKTAETIYRAHFETPDGRLPATFEMICLTGWSPDDTQPKPLRPGSAQARLADALNTTETKLPD